MLYDNKDLKITVSNRLKLHSNFTKLGDLQTQVTASTNTISFSKGSWDYPTKSGILDYLDAASKAALDLTKNEIVANAGQHAMFDTYGYHGFKIDPSTGVYSPKQLWIRNNGIVMTTDNFATIKAAFGEFTLSNGTVVYGLNADTIVAGTIDATTINVTNINATNITTGEFNADLIKTGKIESSNGLYSLDMDTGEVIMKKGTFSGQIQWADGSITNDSVGTYVRSNHLLGLYGDQINIGESTVLVIVSGNLAVGGNFSIDGQIGYSGNAGIKYSNGTDRIWRFVDGVLMDNDV
jgi:hypothetical protein